MRRHTVISITRGEAMAVVRVRVTGGDEITSSVTQDAVDDLELTEGAAIRPHGLTPTSRPAGCRQRSTTTW
jgi:hypothetical protein